MTFLEAERTLLALENELEERIPHRRSLAPGRARPTPLDVLAEPVLRDAPPGRARALSRAATEILRSQIEHFPETCFWDQEYLLMTLAQALTDPGYGKRWVAAVLRLQAAFGRNSTIAFRYLHDFTYGFDWAKWVRRGGPERARTGPLSLEFLEALDARGKELEALIAQDDREYPTLAPGVPRNPFVFSREPADERRLLASLAEDHLIPLQTWTLEGFPRHDVDFSEKRRERAVRLGLELAGR